MKFRSIISYASALENYEVFRTSYFSLGFLRFINSGARTICRILKIMKFRFIKAILICLNGFVTGVMTNGETI